MKVEFRTKLYGVVSGAVIAAAYVILTYVSSLFGFAYGNIQFRVSEALTVLPLFTPFAVPGLFVGCLISNLASPYGIIDIVCGSFATLSAAFVTRALRKVKIAGFPLLSFLAPVIVNALVVGAEAVYFTSPESVTFAVFAITALEVAAGEAAVLLLLGAPFYYFIRKKGIDLNDFSGKNRK